MLLFLHDCHLKESIGKIFCAQDISKFMLYFLGNKLLNFRIGDLPCVTISVCMSGYFVLAIKCSYSLVCRYVCMYHFQVIVISDK